MDQEFDAKEYVKRMIAEGREIIGEKDGHEVAIALIEATLDGYIEVFTAPAGETLYLPDYVLGDGLTSEYAVERAIWDEVIDRVYRDATPEEWAEWEA